MSWDDDERQEEERVSRIMAGYREMSPEDLGRAWQRQCRRHDAAVDRCEEINSPTIQDAAFWMGFIKGEFAKRGLSYSDFIWLE